MFRGGFSCSVIPARHPRAVTASIPQDVLDWFGSMRWSEEPDVFSNEQCIVEGVPMSDVIAALRRVYSPTVVGRNVRSGAGHQVVGLFLGDGWTDDVGMILSLGLDLARMPALLDDVEFVRALRTPRSHDGARLEAGLGAGLVRVGLDPRRPDLRKDQRRPDWLVRVRELLVAIEAKTLGASDSDRNYDSVEQLFGHLTMSVPGLTHPFDATFEMSPMLRSALERTNDEFEDAVTTPLRPALLSALRDAATNNRTASAGDFGTVTIAPPVHGPNVGSCEVRGYTPDDGFARLRRLVEVVKDSIKQFENVELGAHRCVSIWTGRTYLPAQPTVAALDRFQRQLGLTDLPIDTVVVVNSHGRGKNPRFVTEAAVHTIGRRLPDVVLSGLRGWCCHINVSPKQA